VRTRLKFGVVLGALAGLLISAVPVAGAKDQPTATDVGVSADQIRVAVVADVQNPIAPGLNQAVVDAVKGWEKQVNKRGGIAQRKVKVDFYDSMLNPDAANNAFIEACQNDFVLVGTAAFAALNGDAIGTCADKAGAATGLPNLSGLDIVAGTGKQPTTFPLISVGAQDFKQAGIVYRIPVGPNIYIKNKLLKGKKVKMLTVIPASVPGIGRVADAIERGSKQAGAVDETIPKIAIDDSAPQAQFTPIIDTIKREGVNVVYVLSDVAAGKLLKEAQVQGIDKGNVIFNCTTECMGPNFRKTAGTAADGAYMFTESIPINETTVKGMKEYAQAVGADKATGVAALAYAAALNLESLITRVVAKKGVNGVTRKALIDEIKADPSTDTHAMLDKSVKLSIPNPCFVMIKVKGTEFVRAYPKNSGTFDCAKQNVQTVTFGG
jgi:hypothetical protein